MQTVSALSALRDWTAWRLKEMTGGQVEARLAPRVSVRATGARQWDRDNLIAALKPALDALQSVGLVANDRDIVFGAVESVPWKRSGELRPDPYYPELHDVVVLSLEETHWQLVSG